MSQRWIWHQIVTNAHGTEYHGDVTTYEERRSQGRVTTGPSLPGLTAPPAPRLPVPSPCSNVSTYYNFFPLWFILCGVWLCDPVCVNHEGPKVLSKGVASHAVASRLRLRINQPSCRDALRATRPHFAEHARYLPRKQWRGLLRGTRARSGRACDEPSRIAGAPAAPRSPSSCLACAARAGQLRRATSAPAPPPCRPRSVVSACGARAVCLA